MEREQEIGRDGGEFRDKGKDVTVQQREKGKEHTFTEFYGASHTLTTSFMC